MDIAKKLRELRKEKGLTQKELAEKLNLTAHNIGDWERGKCEPSINMVIQLANVLDISIEELCGLDENNFYSQPTNHLSKDEQTVLDCFRELGPFEREAILIQIKALAGTVKESIKK